MKSIKVLHLSSEKAWRGGEQQIAYLIDELSAAGVKSYVAVRKASAFEEYVQRKVIPHISLPFKNSFDLYTAWSVRQFCRQHNIDIVHLHSAKSHTIGVLSSLFGNPATLILSRRVDFAPKQNMLTRWKYNHPSIKRIVCVSDKIKETMKTYVKHPARCVTIHSGIDMLKFTDVSVVPLLYEEFNIDTNTLLIGNTSALDEHKDYFTFIETIHILLKKKLPVQGLIIGTGPLEEALKKHVLSLGLSKEIVFTGFRNDIKKILPSLSVFLMTTRIEGLGTSILDAFLAGVPVVSTRAGGIPEMVTHEQTGMLAPIGDAQTLAAHIERIINDTRFKNSLIEGAKQKVKEFSKERTAEKTRMLYQEVLVSNLPDQGLV
jgi:glycosyltransferase involved in cell wall biosynthesis